MSGAVAAPVEAAAGSTPIPNSPASFTRAAYQGVREGSWEVLVADGSFQNERNVSYSPAADVTPKLSFDGSRVVFASNRKSIDSRIVKPTYDLYVVNVDGSGLRLLYSGPDSASDPVWSYDGRTIVFQMTVEGNADIYAIQADGSGLRRMTHDPAPDFDPTWSPTGDWFIWVRAVDESRGVLMRAQGDGSLERDISPLFLFLERPIIGPRGDRVAFSALPEGERWLSAYVMELWGNQEIEWVAGHADMSDCFASGWSPAIMRNSLENGTNDQGVTIYDGRTLFLSCLRYLMTNEGLVLSQIATWGLWGWGDSHQFVDSPFDFGQHAVSLETTPPWSAVQPLDPIQHRYDGQIDFSAGDGGGSGLGYAEILVEQLAAPDHVVSRWLGVIEESLSVTPWNLSNMLPIGVPLTARIRTLDQAGNFSAWSERRPFTVYTERVAGAVTDNRGLPVLGAEAEATGGPAAIFPSTDTGIFTTWIGRNLIPYMSHLVHPTYGTLMLNTFPAISTPYIGSRGFVEYYRGYAVYYTPGFVNAVVDGDFAAGATTQAWRLSPGALVAGLTGASGHSLLLGGYTTYEDTNPHTVVTAQQVIPAERWADFHAPTLSFLYWIGWQGNPGTSLDYDLSIEGDPCSRFSVSIGDGQSGETTIVLTQDRLLRGRTLGWVDLSPWQGRPITVTFTLEHLDGVPRGYPIIDDVAIAPWLTPHITATRFLTESSPMGGAGDPPPGAEQRFLLIEGENFMGTPQVTIGDVALAPVQVEGSTRLLVPLPASLPPGLYRVAVTNPSGHVGYVPGRMALGQQRQLPLISR